MPHYKIVESVGSGRENVHAYEDISNHHPSKHYHEGSRQYGFIEGKKEEIWSVNGAIQHSKNGHEFVSKDIILLNADTNSKEGMHVPSPTAGYIKIQENLGRVVIFDKQGEQIAQVQHMDLRDFKLKNGDYIEYGQPMGVQSGKGPNGLNDYPSHVHIDFNVNHLEQFKQYVKDIDSGAITTEMYPAKNIATPAADKEYRNKYDIEAQVSSAELTKTAQTLIADATHHTQKWVADNGLQWNEQFNQAAHSVASAAHEKGMTGINLFAVNGGQIDFGHKEGFMLKTGSVETAVASNTDISKSMQVMADVDQKQSQTQSNTQQQTFAQNKEHSGVQRG
jgi:hypothetical protein